MKFLSNTLKRYEEDLREILGEDLIDIILYGSAVTGDYLEGRGDIDILVMVSRVMDNNDANKLFSLHDTYRENSDYLSQLEGTYVTVQGNRLTSGVYIGTTRKGWKRKDLVIFGAVEQGMILQDYVSIMNQVSLDIFFSKDDKKIIAEALSELEAFKLSKIEDAGYLIYAIQTTARNIYTLNTNSFASKSKAIDYCIHHHLSDPEILRHLKKIRYPYKEVETYLFTMDELKSTLNTLLENVRG